MSRISLEKQEEDIALIRSIMVRYPRISIRGVQEALGQMEKPVFSKDYISKIQKKIRGERVHRFNNYVASMVVSQYLDEAQALKDQLWRIITDQGEREQVDILGEDGRPTGKKKWKWLKYPPKNSDRVKAIAELNKINISSMDALFDSGILARKLGEVGVHTRTLEDDLDEYYEKHGAARDITFQETASLPEGQSSAHREPVEDSEQARGGGSVSLKRGTEILLD